MSLLQMVFLPEACDYICENTTDTVKMAESKDGPLVSKYKQLAQQYDVWLSLGGIHLKVSIYYYPLPSIYFSYFSSHSIVVILVFFLTNYPLK